MYKGEPAIGIKFYQLLSESKEFTSELGKIILASGKLESELIQFLIRNKIDGDFSKMTLGKLILIANKNKLLFNNELLSLKSLSKKRNYLSHNIYSLFSDLIDESILEKYNLLDSDVHLYIERASQLAENLNNISNIISAMAND